jgi:hypothetical protein
MPCHHGEPRHTRDLLYTGDRQFNQWVCHHGLYESPDSNGLSCQLHARINHCGRRHYGLYQSGNRAHRDLDLHTANGGIG